jgi:hypothetical protein
VIRINLQQKEFWYLINFFRCDFIFYIGDSNYQLSVNTDKYGNELIKNNLINKHVLVQDGKKLIIDKTIYTNLQTIIFPKHCLICTQQSGKDKERKSSLYFDKKATTLLLTEPRNDSYQIEELDNSAVISSRMFGLPDEKDWTVETKAQFFLGEKEFNQYRSWAQKKKNSIIEEKIKDEKIEMGDHLKISFIKALCQPSNHASLVFIRNVDQPQKSSVDGFALLAADNTLWMLEVIENVDLNMVENRINSLLP